MKNAGRLVRGAGDGDARPAKWFVGRVKRKSGVALGSRLTFPSTAFLPFTLFSFLPFDVSASPGVIFEHIKRPFVCRLLSRINPG